MTDDVARTALGLLSVDLEVRLLRLVFLPRLVQHASHELLCLVDAATVWSGLIIGYVTEYYTSHSYTPVREIAETRGSPRPRAGQRRGAKRLPPPHAGARARSADRTLTACAASRGWNC